MSATSLPYWRLSSFYFFYFAVLGALVPFWGAYLKDNGFSAAQIGELIAILHLTKLLAPYIWGWLADARGQRLGIIRFASLLSAITFVGVFWANSFWSMAAVMLVFSFFWNATLPQFEALTLNHLGDRNERYSYVRLWGSVGFIVSVTLLGYWVDAQGTQTLPIICLIIYVAIAGSSWLVADARNHHEHHSNIRLRQVIKHPAVPVFFIVCFLLQLSHGPYYAFYTIYLQEAGHANSTIGWLWSVGVVAEIILFLFVHRWIKRWTTKSLLSFALIFTALRWFMIALFPQNLACLLFAQIFHAASFGVFHAVSIHWIHQVFVGSTQGRGQAMYSSLTFGAGVALGNFLSGHCWEAVGGMWIFAAASVVALCGCVVAAFALQEPQAVRQKILGKS